MSDVSAYIRENLLNIFNTEESVSTLNVTLITYKCPFLFIYLLFLLTKFIFLLKSALRVILAIRPRNHVSLYVSEFQIMPIDLIFKYRFLILFHRSRLDGEINVKLPLQNKITRLQAEFVPQRANYNRGERSLLTTGVNL